MAEILHLFPALDALNLLRDQKVKVLDKDCAKSYKPC